MSGFTATPRRPGADAWVALVVAEAKMVVRDTAGLVVPIGLPLLILVMNASATSDVEIPGTGGRSALDVYVLPLVLTTVVATIGVVNMPSFLAYYRRTGILRRLAVTPAAPAMVLVAQLVVSALQTALGVVLAVGVAVGVLGAMLPAHLAVAVAVLLLAALAMYAVGLVVAAVAPTPNAAVAIGLVAFFAMGATGGLFGGTDALPYAVASVGSVLPFGASVQVVSASWAGQAVDLADVTSLVAAVVVGVGIASRFFRWE